MYISENIAFCIMHVFEAFSNIKIMFLNITDFIAVFVSIPLLHRFYTTYTVKPL